MARPFIDVVEFTAIGGDGGDGCTSFRRQPHEPRGGPNGGDGGAGGNVILKASDRESSLADLNYKNRIKADDGGRGRSQKKRGKTGEDVFVPVPPGTIVYNAETGEQLGELTEKDEEMVIAHGGKGGRGNRCFSNSRRQTPRFHEFGQTGEEVPVRLELKLLADVGLIGCPNAGKSTLLKSLTRARPKIAEHPFTTLTPNLGVLFNNDPIEPKKAIICDIPGLIEDAHLGAGLGFEFLRHADRTRLLLHVVDLSARSPVSDFLMIRDELRKYDPVMIEKPTIIACNKTDLVEEGIFDIFREEIEPLPGPIVEISAQDQIGLEKLISLIWSELEDIPKPEIEDDEEITVIEMEREKPLRVFPEENYFRLEGDVVEELVSRFELTNPDALSYVRDRLLSIGLHKKLAKAGCEPGDTVRVGDQEFEYTG